MRRLLGGLTLALLAVLAFSLLRYDAYFRDPTLIFWWYAVPLLGALLSLGLLVLPSAGRLALASMLVTVGAAEGVFVALNAWSNPAEESYVSPDYYRDNARLGYAPAPGISTPAWKRKDGRLLYEVEYSIDERGRRITPVRHPGQRDHFLLLFGGSFMFGEGVGDRETLPFFAAERAARHMPYNYAFHGYGPQHLLTRLEAVNLREEVAQQDGILVYLFMDAHVERAIGSMIVYTGWAHAVPHYVLGPDGDPVRRGNLTTGRPWTALLYSVLGRSALLGHFDIDVPPRVTDADIELTARIFAKSARLFREQFGPQRFVVVLYPGSTRAKRLSHALAGHGVESLDYGDLFDASLDEYVIPLDLHPSARAHAAIADRLVADLELGP